MPSSVARFFARRMRSSLMSKVDRMHKSILSDPHRRKLVLVAWHFQALMQPAAASRPRLIVGGDDPYVTPDAAGGASVAPPLMQVLPAASPRPLLILGGDDSSPGMARRPLPNDDPRCGSTRRVPVAPVAG